MKRQYIYIIGMVLMGSLEAKAQVQPNDTTVTRTVVVEQEYTPDILDAQKINVLPKVEPLQSSQKQVEYATILGAASNLPTSTMPILAGKDIQSLAFPGYVRFGLGLPGAVDFLGNYRYAITPEDELNVYALFNGTKGDRDVEDAYIWEGARFYQTRAGIDYTHTFDRSKLDLGTHLGVANFNMPQSYWGGNQNLTSGDLHVGYRSADDNQSIIYNLETNLMLYKRGHDQSVTNLKETGISSKGNILAPLENQQSVGIGFQLDNRFYSGVEFNDQKYKTNHFLDLNPYYVYDNKGWKLHLGAHIGYGFGLQSKLRVAPDALAEYGFEDHYLFYAAATGGHVMNDFRRIEQLSPYGQLDFNQPRTTFEQVNARAGIKGSPAIGFAFNVFAGYQNLKDDAGFMFENYYYGSDTPPANYRWNDYFISLFQADTHNFYGGFALDYDYQGAVALHADGTFRGWGSEKDNWYAEQLLCFKPTVEFNLFVTGKPLSTLPITVGYQHASRKGTDNYSPKAMGNLYATASYQIYKELSVYACLNNILGQKYQYYAGVPAQGFNFVGGISYSF
ncbi:MAG: TonB-dependent receptor [Bacteroidaceae bacterium]|nr:TonB-dependent receptor [Bacteroidaceae bacterium]